MAANDILKASERFIGGIADYDTEGIQDSYAFGRSVDVRSNPKEVTLLPRTIKESGTTIVDLPKWGEEYLGTGDIYLYGDTGNLYKRTTTPVYSLLRSVPNSHGNGLVYSAEDDFLYYPADKIIGRYGPLSGTPTFVDDFFGSQGGVPLNTNSLDLESSSSQYASRADTASLSITGLIAFDAQIKPESLPTSGNTMTLVSKWTENGNLRSYKFGIGTVSNYFGDGSDGALTISGNTTEAPIDSACTGTSGSQSLSATNASFASGQVVLIHQSQGTGAGSWQKNTIQSYTAGTITLVDPLNTSYTTGAQVRVMKQYTNVTINSGITYTAKAWNGTVGGILAFLATGTVTVTGTITASAKGFRGGASGYNATVKGTQGEGTTGTGTQSNSANNTGGGGGSGTNDGGAGGGGGSNATAGNNGTNRTNSGGAPGGTGATTISGSADLTSMTFGGGGGGGGSDDSTSNPGNAIGGAGGGIIFISGVTVTVTGSIVSNGADGLPASIGSEQCTGGGGAGGSVLIKAQTATLGSSLIVSNGGYGGVTRHLSPYSEVGGYAGNGRNHIDYFTSYTGTTTPTLDALQDSNLGTVNGYSLFLSISSNGTNVETLSKPALLTTGTWQQVGVSWNFNNSTAEFVLNGVSLGTVTGSLGSINDNASTFNVGMDRDGASAAQHFYDGLIDEVRLYNTTRSVSQYIEGISSQIATNTTGLVAYYKFNGGYTDSTANANDLTASGSPSFSSDVPYPSPTTRLDIDQSATTSGNTYTTPVAISESATDRKTFTPAKDPQKSVSVLVAAVGTGNWTITVHDTFNNVIATKTVTNSQMTTGYYEFVFANVWRPLTNFTNEYHFHVTSTVADGTVTTGTASDLETVSFRTYYQFLVEDSEFHPGIQFLNFIVFGNERYIAKYEAPLYEPNRVILGAGYRVRSLALWREYLAIGVTKGDDLNNQGRIYFWDGYSSTFNTFIEVPQGGVNSMLSSEGKLFIWAGPQQQQLVFLGGDSAEKIKELPLIGKGESQVYPQGVCMWNSLLRFGVAGSSSSTDIQRGVYTYGSTNKRYSDILTFDYPISTGNYGENVRIGLLVKSGSKLLVGWQDLTGFGVDYIHPDNAPYPTGTIEFIIDADSSWKEKQVVELTANFEPLRSGELINVKYRRDGESAWITNFDSPVEDDSVIRLITAQGRYHNMQMAVDLSTSVSTSPTLNSVMAVVNSNKTERVYG